MQIEKYKNYLKVISDDDFYLNKLRFTTRRRAYEKKRFFSKKLGQMVERMVESGFESERVDLFTEKDGVVYTYLGLERRLLDYARNKGVSVQVETKESLPYPPDLSDIDGITEGLYDDQKEAVREALWFGGGCMIDLPTGAGKTYVIAGLCRAFAKRNGLIVTNKSAVAKRLYDSLKDLCPDNDIGIYVSDMKIPGRSLIITSATLGRINPKNIAFVIYDECHGASGEKKGQNLLKFTNAYRYGLSATIENKFTGMHHYLEAIFGPIVYTLTDEETEDLGRTVPLDVYMIDVNEGYIPPEKAQSLTIEKKCIWNNNRRNSLLAECVEQIPDDLQTLIFVRTEKHISILKESFLPDVEIYHSKLSAPEKRRVLDGFNDGTIKRIISTDSLAEGVDPQNLFVVVNANWGQSETMLQKAGRCRRHADGKKKGIVIDFMDKWTPMLERKSKRRQKQYEDRGYNIIPDATPQSLKTSRPNNAQGRDNKIKQTGQEAENNL